MNKKGAIGTTITWVFAVFIILFMIVIFFAGVGWLTAKQKFTGGGYEASLTGERATLDLGLNNNLVSFLESSVEFEGEEISISDLIEMSAVEHGTGSSLFNERANEIFSDLYPSEGFTRRLDIVVGPIVTHPWWVRVYNLEDKPRGFERTIPDDFFHAGGYRCAPFSQGSLTTVYFVGDKKVVFCIFRDYLVVRNE